MKSQIRFVSMFLLALLLAVSVIGISPTAPAYALSLVVNTLDDLDDSTCDGTHCSLREAIDAANNSLEADTITFSVSGTIYLSSTLPALPPSGSGTLTINGGGTIVISGDTNNDTTPDVTIFSSLGNSQVTIQNLTLEKGTSSSGGGVITNSGQLTFDNVVFSGNTSTSVGQGGGAIFSNGTLTINNSTFSNNSAALVGGAIFIGGGTVQINNSIFSGNAAPNSGGAIYSSNSTVTIDGSQFTSNETSAGGGGAITNLGASGNLTVTNSSFTDNQANSGGAISSSSNSSTTISTSTFVSNDALGNDGGAFYIASATTLTIANSTLSANTTVSRGGGIFAFGAVSMYNVTLSGNTASSGAGGIHTYNTLNIHNTIIANHVNGDCVLDGGTGVIGTHSNNLIESTGANACNLANNGNITGSDPILGTLTGSPAYFPLISGSPAINAGDNAACADAPVNNESQNGISRPQDSTCEIGSYEALISLTVKSNPTYDGHIREASETSGTGGLIDSTATTFTLGDDSSDRQYRAILHFDTSTIPDNAIITSTLLKIKEQSMAGTNPFTSLVSLYVDLKRPTFGLNTLELGDFNAAAKKVKTAVFNSTPASGWYTARFNNGGLANINLTGSTQLRLYFSLDDNDNAASDFFRMHSGNAAAGDRPKLVIQYYVP